MKAEKELAELKKVEENRIRKMEEDAIEAKRLKKVRFWYLKLDWGSKGKGKKEKRKGTTKENKGR